MARSRLTSADVSRLPARYRDQVRAALAEDVRRPAAQPPPTPPPPADPMNGTERRYAECILEPMKRKGLILEWRFEGVRLRLARRTHYTPDFLVVRPGPTFELHEVKGLWRDDARVKIKIAAERFPWFQFFAVRWDAGQWSWEAFDKGGVE